MHGRERPSCPLLCVYPTMTIGRVDFIGAWVAATAAAEQVRDEASLLQERVCFHSSYGDEGERLQRGSLHASRQSPLLRELLALA
mmetsp:Transcript_105068/g.338831  ORF Transcript_105068/g.338831 Transcript_105068/m.338831 type:complete len:85 (+) Transcript_105068:197-451(+)